jgi:hypothetical protein
MKKTLILTLAVGLVSSMTAMADNLDLYITGATAFRQSVHDACLNLFDTKPATNATPSAGTLQYGDSAHGGSGALNNGNGMWMMTGTCSTNIPNLGTNVLTIHALFSGSVQGIVTVTAKTPLFFLASDGTYKTNTPTIGFTDCTSTATPYDVNATADWVEDACAVQPFVWVRTTVGNPLMTNVTGITWQQAKYGITAGRMKLSSWTLKPSDTNLVYLLQRTQDSGTRRVMLGNSSFGYNQSMTVYNYDQAINQYYAAPDNGSNFTTGLTGYGIVGAAGNGGANLGYGPGYVGGGDLRDKGINVNNTNNFSIGYLSYADAKTAGFGSSSNWSGVIALDGQYPVIGTNGSCFKADGTPWLWGNTATNLSFAPIISGSYSGYGNEVVVYPVTAPNVLSTDQNLSLTQLGDATTPGSILGRLLKKYTLAQTPEPGSIEYEIDRSKSSAGGATAIRNAEMKTTRLGFGGPITP